MRGLKYIHSAAIYHRDLKPRNLLVNSNCDLKICDFGLARANIEQLKTANTVMTDYIATRWYRAPEVILSWKNYTGAVDIWSVGCILAELVLRKPLLPASSEEDQLNMITKLLGTPTSLFVNKIENQKSADFVKSLPQRAPMDFNSLFKSASPECIDLLKKMLMYDPEERITVEGVMTHPFLKQLHMPEDEPTTSPVLAFDFDFEKYSLARDDYRQLMYEEIMLWNDESVAHKYMADKQANPDGLLHKKFAHRLRKAF